MQENSIFIFGLKTVMTIVATFRMKRNVFQSQIAVKTHLNARMDFVFPRNGFAVNISHLRFELRRIILKFY